MIYQLFRAEAPCPQCPAVCRQQGRTQEDAQRNANRELAAHVKATHGQK